MCESGIATGRVLVVACLLGLAHAPAGAESQGDKGLYLHVLDIAVAPGVEHAALLSGPIAVDLVVAQPARLAREFERSGQTVLEVSDRRIRVVAAGTPTYRDAQAPEHLAESFIVDYGEPEIVALVEALREKHPADPDATTLREFVHEVITEKSSRVIDLASQVARERRGDCTEHAILLTALARAFGVPARYVTGIVLIAQQESIGAFGHAWTELHDGQRWVVTDATMLEKDAPDAVIRYIPLQQLTTEGVNYAMGVLALAAVLPHRIEIVGPVGLPE